MSEDKKEISRRTVLKNGAITGAGFVASGNVLAVAGDESLKEKIDRVVAKDEWLAQRAYCLSGNKVLANSQSSSLAAATDAREVYRPRTAQEIAEIVKSLPKTTPVACVCGGHESSNAAMFASREAVVLDLVHLKSIQFHQDDDESLVTVGAGVIFRELVEAVKGRHGALPVGTGPDVGVVGYIVNGGLSGYFSRRLGLLGPVSYTHLTLPTKA